MGVLGGRCLSKNSGESAGPKVTLFLDRLLGGAPLLIESRSGKNGRERLPLLAKGEGLQLSSLDSGIDFKEDDKDDKRLLLRRSALPGGQGIGVDTFSFSI